MARKLTKREQKKVNKFIFANWKFFLVLLLLVVTLGIVAYYMGWLNIIFKPEDEEPPILSTAGGHITEVNSFGDLEVNFLNVGQADCIVIELPDGMTMMIDTGDGSIGATEKSNATEKKVIENFLSANNISVVDYLLITHSDADHVGNAAWLLENYPVRFIFRPHVYSNNDISENIPSEFNVQPTDSKTFISNSDIYAKFIVAAYNEGCTVEYFNKDSDFTNTLKCGDEEKSYLFNFLTPTAKREEISYKDANNFSPIMMLEYAGKRFMFNGDAELENIEEYVTNYGDAYNVDVLKVGHHGSTNATTEEYITAIDPEYAVIQNGWVEKYNHPHQSTLDILSAHDDGVAIYRTDNNGNILCTVTADGEMSWSFDDNDMSKNLFNGTKMLELLDEKLTLSIDRNINGIERLQEFISLCIIENGNDKRKNALCA